MPWTSPDSPRIWRYSHSFSYSVAASHDEPLHAAGLYTDEVLARIAAEGFNGIWLFCQLYDLMDSRVFPQLNRPRSPEFVASVQTLVERAARHGIGVYLYFNDPRGIPVDDPFWQNHAELKGVTKWGKHAICTSTPQGLAFFEDAVESVARNLPGLAGVILITACEDITHCWSKRNTRRGDEPPECPRCRVREPADLVLDLLGIWSRVSRAQERPFRVLAWNWEWAYWYEDPQSPITTRLPEGVELLLDMELGGQTQRSGRPVTVGEYSLSYVGPSERLLATHAAVAGRTPIHAKLQISNTHELATVPNVPVMHHLHAKLAAMTKLNLAGYMACWDLGSCYTLNSFAARLFMQQPQRYLDRDAFLHDLAVQYFGLRETDAVVEAWATFSDAFALYPLNVQLIYRGPHNDAPARTMSLEFDGQPIASSYLEAPGGEDLSPCLATGPHDTQRFTATQVADTFADMARRCRDGCATYREALADIEGSPEQQQHAREERSVAEMIACLLQSTSHHFAFHDRRSQLLEEHSLAPPCTLPADPQLLAIMRSELAVAEHALQRAEVDHRLGWHQSIQRYKFDPASIRRKIDNLRQSLSRHA